MFLNLTAETCTGTANVLTLTGALANRNAFGKTGNGEDGATYSCVVDDADGVVHVAGIYTFDKTANTLTRNDTWNDNGTVIDKNPATNIALSGGTHTVRCDVTAGFLFTSKRESVAPGTTHYHTGDGSIGAACWNTGSAPTANRVNTAVFTLSKPTLISELIIKVSTSDAAATNAVMGVYSSDNQGKPSSLLATTVNFAADLATTGDKVYALDAAITLPAGTYFQATVTDSTVVRYYVMNDEDSDSPNWKSFSANGMGSSYYMNNVSGALPATFVVNGASILNNGPLGLR